VLYYGKVNGANRLAKPDTEDRKSAAQKGTYKDTLKVYSVCAFERRYTHQTKDEGKTDPAPAASTRNRITAPPSPHPKARIPYRVDCRLEFLRERETPRQATRPHKNRTEEIYRNIAPGKEK